MITSMYAYKQNCKPHLPGETKPILLIFVVP